MVVTTLLCIDDAHSASIDQHSGVGVQHQQTQLFKCWQTITISLIIIFQNIEVHCILAQNSNNIIIDHPICYTQDNLRSPVNHRVFGERELDWVYMRESGSVKKRGVSGAKVWTFFLMGIFSETQIIPKVIIWSSHIE